MDITQALALFAFAAILAVFYTFPHLTYITTTKINLRKKTSTIRNIITTTTKIAKTNPNRNLRTNLILTYIATTKIAKTCLNR